MSLRSCSLTRTIAGIVSSVALVSVATAPALCADRPSAALVASAPATQHRYFGRMQSANGTSVTLRLRNGRLLSVDASEAFALNRVSEPLFPGKSTVVQGLFSANGIFHASSVMRAAPRSTSWDIDR